MSEKVTLSSCSSKKEVDHIGSTSFLKKKVQEAITAYEELFKSSEVTKRVISVLTHESVDTNPEEISRFVSTKFHTATSSVMDEKEILRKLQNEVFVTDSFKSIYNYLKNLEDPSLFLKIKVGKCCHSMDIHGLTAFCKCIYEYNDSLYKFKFDVIRDPNNNNLPVHDNFLVLGRYPLVADFVETGDGFYYLPSEVKDFQFVLLHIYLMSSARIPKHYKGFSKVKICIMEEINKLFTINISFCCPCWITRGGDENFGKPSSAPYEQ